ncbi:loganic acid O-methyltransferase-like [Andrographis paniculata]|uniref:loganic acid O-methyltransferase-like n=1 Tax=Andrographis paniculata TaxID=175694 RepID=UPI0021E71875|nr:loganic acid O-methyltransferase-like [Andrographis paniculata]
MEEESFPMNGGEGAHSYSKNSHYQKLAHDLTKRMVQDTITRKLKTIFNPFCIADYGCSVGPNTFFAIQNVIEAVQHKCASQKELEFQVFFNDHTTNDFNTLIACLPSERQYYSAMAPGSFYGRVLPRASVHIAHSCLALQWLTQVPKTVCDSKSPAWNPGRIYYTKDRSPKAMADAYAEQFNKDMQSFISARAQEIVPGGLMVLTMPGICDRDSPSRYSIGFFEFLGTILMEMANEGTVEKGDVDAFNLALYAPSIEEMKEVIEKNGCFEVERIELTTNDFEVEATNIAGLIINFRAALEGYFRGHFGSEVTNKMFDKALEESDRVLSVLRNSPHELFVALKRK